jgi:hypothetical protein
MKNGRCRLWRMENRRRGSWFVEDGRCRLWLMEDGRCGLWLVKNGRRGRRLSLLRGRGNVLGLGRSALNGGCEGSRLHGRGYRTTIRIQDDILGPDTSVPPPKARVIGRIRIPPGWHR